MQKITEFFQKTWVKESLKELFRDVLIAVVTVLMTSINVETGQIVINQAILIASTLMAFLRWLDRTLHEWGKSKKLITEDGVQNNWAETGLTRF